MLPSGEDGPPNPEKDRKVGISVFKNSPATVFIQQHPQAKWNLVQVKQIKENGDTALIKMVMQCSDSSGKRLLVDTMRQQTASVDTGRSAEWRIGSISVE